MKKLTLGTAAAILLSGCSLQPSIPNERVGDIVFIYNQPNSDLAKEQANVMCGGSSYRIYNIGHGYSGKAGSIRLTFACTQKSALEHGNIEAKDEVRNGEVKKDMQRIADIPWDGAEAHKFFLKETHLFMLLQCGWAGSIGFSTGSNPLVMLGDSYYPGEKSAFKNGEYSITFNGGSMFVAYNPQKVSGYISDRHSFTPCAVVRLGED